MLPHSPDNIGIRDVVARKHQRFLNTEDILLPTLVFFESDNLFVLP